MRYSRSSASCRSLIRRRRYHPVNNPQHVATTPSNMKNPTAVAGVLALSLAAATYDASRLLYSSVAFVDDPPSPSSPEPGAFTTSTHRVLSTELRLPESQETQSSAAPALIVPLGHRSHVRTMASATSMSRARVPGEHGT